VFCLAGAQQLYVWIGCNSARMGNLYAALPTRWVFSSPCNAWISSIAARSGRQLHRGFAGGTDKV
jgi:hypothetical protein